MTISYRLKLLGFVVLIACGGISANAQQFQADLSIVKGDGDAAMPAGKLRVINDKVRIETPEFANAFFLIDGGKGTAYFVQPADRIFMAARQSSRLTRLFVQVDPANPCSQWWTMAKLAGIASRSEPRCERIGQETIAGRAATAYRMISSDGPGLVGWIDPDLKFPLRIRTDDGAVVTAENLKEEPQAVRLFEIPPGFRKFDPRDLIERVKQSDVWVEEPR